ncbi:hypothetical protein J2X61_004681 [Bacillus sp. 3255]|nr:hypothetical protein [Bacillus sp. 3255]
MPEAHPRLARNVKQASQQFTVGRLIYDVNHSLTQSVDSANGFRDAFGGAMSG